MHYRAALLLCSVAAFAQTPPPDVDAALRARVNEFYGYHVTGEFEKAYGMVAEDTRKEYFGAEKKHYQSFKIDSINYSDDFTKATVNLTVSEKKELGIRFPATTFTYPSETTWKIESGKWCWYHDSSAVNTHVMPFGESDPKAIAEAKKRDQASVPVSDENIRKMALNILGQSGLDKSQLTLAADKPSADQLVFKNGQGGSIKIALVQVDLPPGMTATLDKNDLTTGEQAVLKVSYTPNGKDKAPANFMLQLVMEPFSRVFPVTVHFTQAQ